MEDILTCSKCKTSNNKSFGSCKNGDLNLEKNEKVLFCCWISKVPNEISKECIQEIFKDSGKRFGQVVSVKCEQNKKYNCNQCFINYLTEKSMNDAVNFFNDSLLMGEKLIASPKGPCFSNKIIIGNSKFLKKQLEEKIGILKFIYPTIIFDVTQSNQNFQVFLQSNDKKIYEEAVKIIKQWTVFTKSNFIIRRNLERIQRENYNKAFIEIDQKNSEVKVYSFEKDEVDKILKDLVCRSEDDLNDKKTYCCLIMNIPREFQEIQIKNFFLENGIRFGQLQSINIKFNNQYGMYQCFLHYLEEDSVNYAINYFNNLNLYGQKLKAKNITRSKTIDQEPRPKSSNPSRFFQRHHSVNR